MENLEYFTPTTLEEMYKDLDEARSSLFNQAQKENFNIIETMIEYIRVARLTQDIDIVYFALTGNKLKE